MSAVLLAESLGKRYGSNWALRDCSFAIEPGRVAALVGPNGAGKSTLLELAIGLLKPTEGVLSVMGASPVKEPLVGSATRWLRGPGSPAVQILQRRGHAALRP